MFAQMGPTANLFLSASRLVPIGLSRAQLGYVLGIGADLTRLLNSSLFGEIRYAGDFRSFYDHPNAKLWNRVWMFSLGTTL